MLCVCALPEPLHCHAQGIASTPFLAGLDRTLPQLTPGISPEALAMFQVALPTGATLASSADVAATQAPTENAAPASPNEAPRSSSSAADLTHPQEIAEIPAHAAKANPAAEEGPYEGLLDLSPMPGVMTQRMNVAFLESPDADALSMLCQVSPMGGRSSGKPTPVLFGAAPAPVQDPIAQLSPEQEAPVAASSVLGVASGAAKQRGAKIDARVAALQDEESVGSASPSDAAGAPCRSEAAAAADTCASAVRGYPAPVQVLHSALLPANGFASRCTSSTSRQLT